MQNLVRYRPVGTYFARFRINGKRVWKSLETTVFSVAKQRLPETMREHRAKLESVTAVTVVFGNSRQFFLMRQNDRADLDDMAADIGLTELTKHAILSYPLPDQQKGEKFSAFTYLHNDAQNPICGTAHNVASPEMLYISGSSGRSSMSERVSYAGPTT